MKRVISILLSITMLLSVIVLTVACSEDTPTSTTQTKKETSIATTSSDVSTETTQKQNEQNETTANSGNETTTQDPGTPTTPEENNGRQKLTGYEDVDFGGKEFLVATYEDQNTAEFFDECDFWVESYSGDAVLDAVFERNQVMKKLYNCTIKAVSGYTDFDADVASGTGKYFGKSAPYQIGRGFVSSTYYNVLKFDIDFTQPWWDQAFFRDLTCNGKIFGVCGDFSIRAMRTPWIMYFNKDVYETKFSDVDIYQIVRDHKWTFDKMVEFISKIKNDTDGDQEYKASAEAGADIMGLVTTGHIYRTFYFSAGLRMITSDNGKFKVAFAEDTKGPDVVDKLIEVIKTEGFSTAGYTMADNCIMSGTTLFVANIMGQLYEYESAENLRLGIIPCPLFEEGGEYATYCDNHAPFLALSTAYGNVQELSDFLTLFAFHSSKFVRPAYVNQIKYTFGSDEDSAEMVDIILDSRVYDAGYLMYMSDGFYGAYQAMVESGKNQWAQAVQRQGKATQNLINEYENKLAGIDDNY